MRSGDRTSLKTAGGDAHDKSVCTTCVPSGHCITYGAAWRPHLL
ncbi:MAG: hypothetical protein ACI30J_01725 [Paludibacteraceae bacterium]